MVCAQVIAIYNEIKEVVYILKQEDSHALLLSRSWAIMWQLRLGDPMAILN